MQEKDKNDNINLGEQFGRQEDTSNRISNKRKQPQDEDDLEAEYTVSLPYKPISESKCIN
ncbi:hypothetical protein NF27_FF00030 [Candidatus Jidaibacter acanthamoeba]|uniref:Uncharacterized protein n=1 Tax=Candidatus Jidaibacter acanthamoebae TaxID=86105 RepID=A0A0C1MS44_9RICK|nr:hypothetical protein [Candidatus Jidaibacter acanthamoeba]KIE04892.1 hypothetical protein NF27_FF00030 [Candidatus Jidaibacter acanthamoeba]